MPTSFDEINTIFYDLVEEDEDFFNYYGISPVQSMNMAEARADSCLRAAALKVASENETDINFADFDTETREFAADLTPQEKNLLAHLQYERYLYRDFAGLRAQATRFTSAEQSVFSPANERKTFLQMYQALVEENRNSLNLYLCRDRLTGERKSLPTEDF